MSVGALLIIKQLSYPILSYPILYLEQQQKRFLKIHYEIRILLFLSYSFEIETIHTFIHSLFPSKTIWLQTWMGKVYWPFLDQNSAKPLPFGVAHTYVAYIREYPSGGSNEMLTEKVGESFILTDQWWWRVTYDVIQHKLRNFPLLLISFVLFHVDRPFTLITFLFLL